LRGLANRRPYQSIILVLVCLGLARAANEPAFVFEDPLRFNLNSSNPSTYTISFLVFSSVDAISNLSVKLRNGKTPDNQNLPNEAATAANSSTEVTRSGTVINVQLNPAFFRQPGEYRLTLIVEGTASGKTITSIPSLVVVRPSAEINVDELKDHTFHLVRSWPFGVAQGSFPFNLQEISGKSDINNVEVTSHGLVSTGTRERVPGKISVVPAQEAQRNQDAPELMAATTPTYTQANLNLNFEDIGKIGAHETLLIVQAPTISGRKLIPVRVNVSDAPYWPFLVIGLGVFGGFWVSNAFNQWRPRQLNKSTILRLRAEVARLRQRVKSVADVATVENMWRGLRIAEESNESSDLAQVNAQVQQIQKDLDDFRKTLATAKSEVQKTATDLKLKLDHYSERFAPLEPEEETALQTIRLRLADTQWLLRQDYVDDARERLAILVERFSSLHKLRLTKQLDHLTSVFSDLESKTEPEDQEQSSTFITEARTSLSQDRLEELESKLVQLTFSLKDLGTKVASRLGARGGPPRPSPSLPEPRVVNPLPRLEIITRPNERTTDSDVAFQIIDPGRMLEADDRFLWNFGESEPPQEAGMAANHRYQESGDYEIVIDVSRGGQTQPRLRIAEQVKILPGKTELALRDIGRTVKRYDLALSLVALLLASLTGLLFLYVGKNFGTLSDYLLAFFWGFGIDSGVRGFANVMGRMTAGGGIQ
jgi:hypothetical protein